MLGRLLYRILGIGFPEKADTRSDETGAVAESCAIAVAEAPALIDPVATGTQSLNQEPPSSDVKIHSGVLKTMFEDFHAHRQTERGEEETGWLLLGRRTESGAVIEAALPPGEFRDAGTAHVNMNSTAQAVAMRILKKHHPELDVLGVAHTHPGRLNRPSQGDYQGDSLWVSKLRKREGIFAIGVWDFDHFLNFSAGHPNYQQEDDPADVRGESYSSHSSGRARFFWFALAEGEKWYRHLSLEETPGKDLGHEIRGHWEVIEEFAGSIDRLVRMQPALQMGLIPLEMMEVPTMVLCQPLAREGEELQVILQGGEVGFFRMTSENSEEIVGPSDRLDAAFYEVMARLARGPR